MLTQKSRLRHWKLFFVYMIIPVCFADNSNNNEKLEEYLTQLESVISKISSDDILDKIIIQEKVKLIQSSLKESKEENNIKEDKEAYFFTPKNPKPLTDAEKKIDIHERIGKKYIGKLPLQVNNLIFYFSNHEECVRKNKTISNRLLLHGYPGTGKSYLVKILAEELQIPMFTFSASFFADKYIGESSRRIRRAFEEAKKLNKPVFIFIDEIDALATKRTASTHDEHRATLITLLTELQDLQDNKNVFVFAATNDYWALDWAIRDRFAGSVHEVKQPTIDERAQLFQKILMEKGLNFHFDFVKRLAEVVDTRVGEYAIFSNRDVEHIVTAAAFLEFSDCKSNRENCSKHWCHYFREAIDSTKKEGSYAKWWFPKYCNGI